MDWLIAFSQDHTLLVYGVTFVMMFLEGDISLLIFGALSRGRYLNFSTLFFVAFIATLVHDMIFWKIGAWLAKREKKKYFYFDLDTFVGFMERYRSFAGVVIIFSKFAWNFNRIILISAGYVKIPLKKVMRYSFVTALLWPSLYMSVGYIFADQTDIFKQRFEIIALGVAGILILLMVFERYIRKLADKIFFGKMNGLHEECKKKEIKEGE
ncbi:MAG: hypothetical protein WC099_01995 [Candidatus Paceibacterota bacterium]